MNDIEKKLAKYRAKKEREARVTKFKTQFKDNMASYFFGVNNQESNEDLLKSDKKDEYFIQSTSEDLSDIDSFNEDDAENINCCTYTDLIYYSLWFILWATVYLIFIKLEFGTAYFLVTGLIAIYFNTRTRPRKDGEISAYSVFNKNCESIDGTLKAEQFEREIRYGPAGIR